MQTRSGRRFPSSKTYQTLKEVRILCKKRHASAIDCPQLQEDAPAFRKRKSPKTVRFAHHADCEHGVPRYKGRFPQDSIETEKESGPSEGGLRTKTIGVDDFLAGSEEENQLEVLKANETEQCAADTREDSDDELGTGYMPELEERTVTSFLDDLPHGGEDEILDQRAGRLENDNNQPIPKAQQAAVINIASSNSSPTDQKDRDREYKQRYLNLKTTAWNWSSTYFSPPTPTPASTPPSPNLNLLELCHTSPQLMEYANYISVRTDASTWEDVFNKQRAFLVYSILGKMVDVHIFGHEMYGATDEQLSSLRSADEECIMDDGIPPLSSHPLSIIHLYIPPLKTPKLTPLPPAFHRQTKRANAISAFLSDPPPQGAAATPNILPPLSHLLASFLKMLSPLLPPRESQKLKRNLATILLQASTLSLLLRRDTSAIYNWHMHPAPGTPYSRRSMHILDRGSVSDSVTEVGTQRVVTMAG